jgi:phasin family protein
MYMTPEQMMASQKASMEAMTAFGQTAFASFEKLLDLNIKVMKATLDEATQKVSEAAELKDVQDAIAFASNAAQPAADKVMAYSRHVYDILSTMNAEFAKMGEAQLSAHQKKAAELIEQMAKNAPAGSETAVSLIKSSFAASTAAYEQFSKAAKQAAEVAQSNMVTVADNAMKAAATATDSVKATASRTRKAA